MIRFQLIVHCRDLRKCAKSVLLTFLGVRRFVR
jgi:hypothetical protein